MSSTNNSFYNSGASATTGRAPPPPPKPAGNTGTSRRKPVSRNSAVGSSSQSRSAYQSNRATSRTSKALPKGTGTASNGISKTVRKAPMASRPVGSYYNSTPAAPTNEAIASSDNTGPNFYGTSAPSPSPTMDAQKADDDADTWDDWGSPTPKTSTRQGASTNDWYSSNSAGSKTGTSTNDWYSANNSVPNSSYTSSGFHNRQTEHPAQMQQGSGFYQTGSNENMQQGQSRQGQQQQPVLSGAMDTSAPQLRQNMIPANENDSHNPSNTTHSFSMFMPSAQSQTSQEGGNMDAYASIEDEAPLLEELGINLEHIFLKTRAVVFPFSRFGGDQIDPAAICQDADLPGPVALLLLLGAEMMLVGKLQFGYIYVYGLCGCILMTFVVNLISPTEAVSFWIITSIMGYSLLPVNILALLKIFVVNLINLQTLGNILGGLTILWSTLASTRLMELGCGLRDQRYLIMYPLFLFYSAFVMMTIL